MRVRLAIGDFSRMTHLSVKALRHYHDLGLLEPAEIDPRSGYRFWRRIRRTAVEHLTDGGVPHGRRGGLPGRRFGPAPRAATAICLPADAAPARARAVAYSSGADLRALVVRSSGSFELHEDPRWCYIDDIMI